MQHTIHRGPIRGERLWPLLALGLAVTLGFFTPTPAPAFGTPQFPCPTELSPRVAFWVRIFTEFRENQRVIHDARYPWVIYDVLEVAGLNQRQIKVKVESRKSYFSALLARLAGRDPATFNLEEKRIASLLADVPEKVRYADARDRVHSQPGVMEQFRLGLRRSTRYFPTINTVLDSCRVPREIAYIPFVESSFCPSAKSKVGATGLWQFTKKTGKRYLRVERDLDERLDPVLSTEAAARYLSQAYKALDSWPLAVMSYNHGVGGMMRAVSQIGCNDVSRVLLEYDGPSYGFASQNFYCEFLAAIEVARQAEKHFGELVPDPPYLTDTFRLPAPVKVPALARVFSLTAAEISELNPAFGPALLQGVRPAPPGYMLRLPLGKIADPAAHFAAAVSKSSRASTPSLSPGPAPTGYKVRPGDTLDAIARRHKVTSDKLRQANDLRSGDRIFPGQILVLPGKGSAGM